MSSRSAKWDEEERRRDEEDRKPSPSEVSEQRERSENGRTLAYVWAIGAVALLAAVVLVI